ncbi:ABC transporter permease [Leucobacter sp. CSA1]|uniref:ABC transporter permease n=1 Tax=Leucobacter chromiisoli TaxID=2796471 RepID=A0A934Q4V5_9MICO|nr:ABC transporter permease [Leucobacter chromiisoli]MBK0417653.1 ABC transporter permease [Leucobacter chromiisoli]
MRSSRLLSGIAVIPALAVILIFFLLPIGVIIYRSFTEPDPGLGQYAGALADPTTLRVLGRTFLTAVIAVIVCVLLGYPYAYLMTLVGPMARTLLMVLVLVPFWTSLMARTFAWISLLQRDGPVSAILGFFGAQDVTLLGSATGVILAIVQILLPYMILTLFTALGSIDRRQLAAAQSLGANRYRTFWQVYLPQSLPGLFASSALVFILALGFYITPQLIGSPKEAMISQVIGLRVEKIVDFAGAGALSGILLIATLGLFAVAILAIAPLRRSISQMINGGERS